MPSGHIISDEGNSGSHDKHIAINMGIRIVRRIDHTPLIQHTDVITKCIMYAFRLAEHNAAASVIVAVVVLINSSVARIRIPGLTVLIFKGMVCFIILKQSALALPGPYGGSCLSLTFSGQLIYRIVHFHCHILRHIILYQGTQAVHGRNSITAYAFHIVMLQNNIRMAISFHDALIQTLSGKKRMGIAVAGRNPPPAAVFHHTVMNVQPIIAGNGIIRFFRL